MFSFFILIFGRKECNETNFKSLQRVYRCLKPFLRLQRIESLSKKNKRKEKRGEITFFLDFSKTNRFLS